MPRASTAKAEPLYQRALAISEKALGPEHPDVARSLNNLAAALRCPGPVREGRAALPARARHLEKALGPEHPDVAQSLNNLALLYDAQGPEHPHVATSLNNLAELYRTQGQYGKAEPLYAHSPSWRKP